MNKRPGRDERARCAEDTLRIVAEGSYISPSGETVTIKEQVSQAVEQTVVYRPGMLSELKGTVERRITGAGGGLAEITVTTETTLEAARRLVAKERVRHAAALNFASAKNPGGGFLGGSQAQEESLARSSALYACIEPQTEMYKYNKGLKSCLYSDYMIYSPEVPVIREDGGELLDSPYLLSFITAPAVNAGVVREREPGRTEEIHSVMLERIRYILSIAAEREHAALVLGAYGCGVFRNDPEDVAGYFRQVLVQEGYGRLFKRIVFAVYDSSPSQRVLHAFQQKLSHN